MEVSIISIVLVIVPDIVYMITIILVRVPVLYFVARLPMIVDDDVLRFIGQRRAQDLSSKIF